MDKLQHIVDYFHSFNLISVLLRIILAALLGGLIGIERSKNGRAAGLRTHILVCLGATLASMTGLYINYTYGGSGDVTRIAAQVISGIGFLGAGTILVKNESFVTGLTTAACVWATGALGVALGYGFYVAAIITTFLIVLINGKLNRLDKRVFRNAKDVRLSIEFVNAKYLNDTLKEIEAYGWRANDIIINKTKTNLPDGIGCDMILHIDSKDKIDDVINRLNAMENVHFAILTHI